MTKHVFAGLAAALLVVSALPTDAKSLRWASRGDILTMDPHAQDENLTNMVADQIYEPLVTRDRHENRARACTVVDQSTADAVALQAAAQREISRWNAF